MFQLNSPPLVDAASRASSLEHEFQPGVVPHFVGKAWLSRESQIECEKVLLPIFSRSSCRFDCGEILGVAPELVVARRRCNRLLVVDLKELQVAGEAAFVGFEPYYADGVQGQMAKLVSGSGPWFAIVTRDGNLLWSHKEDWRTFCTS